MSKAIESLISFLGNIDNKLLIAGALMLLIFGLIIYILTIIVFSLKQRAEFSKVRLPRIDGVGEDSITNPQFKSVLPLDVEIIQDEGNIRMRKNAKNDEAFLAALVMESRTYIPNKELEMPDISEIKENGDKGDAIERSSESKVN